jgi:phage terminase small subunit
VKLTEKQKRFAEEYVKTGNATQSYINAGYSATKREVAEANARKLLGNYSSITQYIKELNNQLISHQIADMEEVKTFWTNTMRSGNAELKDRLKASEYIAKTNAAFIEKKEITGEMTQNINADLSKLSVEELKQIESILSKTD